MRSARKCKLVIIEAIFFSELFPFVLKNFFHVVYFDPFSSLFFLLNTFGGEADTITQTLS